MKKRGDFQVIFRKISLLIFFNEIAGLSSKTFCFKNQNLQSSMRAEEIGSFNENSSKYTLVET